MPTEHPRFAAHVDQAVDSLRERLLADVMATAERDQRRPVRRLAELRSAIGQAPVQTPAQTTKGA